MSLFRRQQQREQQQQQRARECRYSIFCVCGYSRDMPVQEPGNGNQLAYAGGGPGKSFLFCLRRRDPGCHSQEERVLVTRLAVERRGSCGVPSSTVGP